MLEAYDPGKNLSFDVPMVFLRGILSFRQYKIKRRSMANMVLHLMEERFKNVGHSLYMDNFYNSYDLPIKELERKRFALVL